MESSIPLQIAETIQTASIRHNPSVYHDINPSTAASRFEPVILEPVTGPTTSSHRRRTHHHHHDADDDDFEDDDDDDDDEIEEGDEIPYSIVRPKPRGGSGVGVGVRPSQSQSQSQHRKGLGLGQHQQVPMPDLRFEQSYLRSIAGADTWWKVVWITARDQVMMPLAQGVLYNLAICGWQFYNRNAQLHGGTLGARVRRWWWGVNKWPIPPSASSSSSSSSSSRSSPRWSEKSVFASAVAAWRR